MQKKKTVEKIQHSSIKKKKKKKNQQTRNRELIPPLDNIYKNSTSNIRLNDEKTYTFILRSGTRQKCSFSPLYSTLYRNQS